MEDRAAVGVVDRVDDLQLPAAGERQAAAVARLTAAARIEHSCVRRDASGRDGEHARLRLAPIGVVTEQRRGRHKNAWRNGRLALATRPGQAASSRAEMSD